ncbi:MAG TPA: DNA oxidative demethylase AlkB [Steroidobacteraceae bacterium]|jgi:alkylated DNA repair protein (DNA oxidative demethylase)
MKDHCAEPSGDLFDSLPAREQTEVLGPGAVVLRGFVRGSERELLDAVAQITTVSPYRHLITPGGFEMSVAMTNCGELGWVSDRSGYRYDAVDPVTSKTWPQMPELFRELALRAAARAGFESFQPDACLINRYQPGTRLSLHRDYDEKDSKAPIVSVSLGVPARFQWGGLRRNDPVRPIVLESGDVVVWGGESRFVYHGIAALPENCHALTGRQRINLTFRRAGWKK